MLCGTNSVTVTRLGAVERKCVDRTRIQIVQLLANATLLHGELANLVPNLLAMLSQMTHCMLCARIDTPDMLNADTPTPEVRAKGHSCVRRVADK